jgi:uncharacterized repeat protein (TIGR03803 family)
MLTTPRSLPAFCIAMVWLSGCNGLPSQAGSPVSGFSQRQNDARPQSNVDSKSAFARLFSFSLNDGALPAAGLVSLGGAFYGTTQLGGNSNCFGGYSEPGCGVVLKVTTSGKETAIYSFKGAPDGSHSFAPLIAVKGNLYGTTIKGGTYCASSSTYGCGTVFKITPTGKETVLHQFAGGNDGSVPSFYTPLVYVDGALYGITKEGGANDAGTLFKVTLSGTESVLYSFQDLSPQAWPQGLVFAKGAFYGASLGRGRPYSNDYGSIFKVTLSGKESTLYTFKGSPHDGAFPSGQIVAIGDTLYGATSAGGIATCGPAGCGTLFSITMKGKETVLHRFDPKKEGAIPYSGLIGASGTLYGANCCAGPFDGGTVFKATTAGQVTVLHSFTSYSKAGSTPYGSLTMANGKLYGTTGFGGNKKKFNDGYGTIFRLSP